MNFITIIAVVTKSQRPTSSFSEQSQGDRGSGRVRKDGNSPSGVEEASSSSSSHRDCKSPGRSITLSGLDVGRTDMDWESGVFCKFDLENRVLIFDFFFLSLEEDSSSLSTEGVVLGTMAEVVSDALSLFFPLILSFSFPKGFRDLSFMERSNMLAVMLFLINWISTSISPRSLSFFPGLDFKVYHLEEERTRGYVWMGAAPTGP